jgi:anti-anti-sigma regulatory factor
MNTPNSDTVTLTRAELTELFGRLKEIGDGEMVGRLEVSSESPGLAEIETELNGFIARAHGYLMEDRDATMSLALGLSECFSVLASVRQGDLSARVSSQTLAESDDLMMQFGQTLNDTIADIQTQLDTIQRQQSTQTAMESLVRQLQTPILQLWDDVLALPVIGMVDSRRSADMMETLLKEIIAHRSKYVIIDVTGVEIVDTRTADHFVKVMKSAELLGTKCIMTGIRPAVAQTLVELGVDLSSIRTLRNLEEGLRACLREMNSIKARAAKTGEM